MPATKKTTKSAKPVRYLMQPGQMLIPGQPLELDRNGMPIMQVGQSIKGVKLVKAAL